MKRNRAITDHSGKISESQRSIDEKAIVALTTQRLLLKSINTAHAEEIFRYRSDSVTNRYQGWIPKDVDDVLSFITNRTSREINVNGTWFQLVITLNATGEIIGDIGLHFAGSGNEQAELGCTIGMGHQGNGYATEALTEVISYLFNSLDKQRLIASIDPANVTSIKLFERLGFKPEDLKDSSLPDESRVADLVYYLSKKQKLRYNLGR